jgi:hypothetical protein
MWLVVCAAACSNPTAPVPVGYDGEWVGITAHGTPVSFSVSENQVTSFTLAFNFSPACSGTETIPGPAAIVMRDPPGPPPHDQPGFAMSKTNQGPIIEWAVLAAGPFAPDRRSASGQFQLVQYPGCGTLNLTWSAGRR